MQIIRQFWWGEEEDRRKVHWTSWKTLIKPKIQEGMGFRDSELFNQALLARQAWRLIQNPKSLDARLLKAIYYPRGNITDNVFRAEASPVWHGIDHDLELLKKGLVWRIGDGKTIRIWRDNWLPRNFALRPRHGKTKCRYRRVVQLVDNNSGTWNQELVQKIFYEQDEETILQLNAPVNQCTDFVA
jgi:hypothetical protein